MDKLTLHSQVYWLRDEERIFVLIPHSAKHLCITGPQAQLWEMWMQGHTPASILQRVALCYGLSRGRVRQSFRALVTDLQESEALDEQSEPLGETGLVPLTSQHDLS